MSRIKIVNVVGARPNFMKIAPIVEALRERPVFDQSLVHTGQHYDARMSELFFDQLGLPRPDFYLGIGSGSHGAQTGRVMIEFEQTLNELQPDIVLVVGDVNSTIACGMVAVKMGIRLVHVEAGLRSYDRTMPEEVNRVLTDQISDYLFTTERSALDNLVREGIDANRVFFVGNVMIDSLLKHRAQAVTRPVLAELGIEKGGYGLITLHRPANVDDPEMFARLLEPICELAQELPILFPMHPRARSRLAEFGLEQKLESVPSLKIVDPLGYLDFMCCMDGAKFVLTDSGGVQEETTVLGVPCITARDNTERPVTVTAGTNVMVGRDPARILEEARRVLNGEAKQGATPELWDGGAAPRIVAKLEELESA